MIPSSPPMWAGRRPVWSRSVAAPARTCEPTRSRWIATGSRTSSCTTATSTRTCGWRSPANTRWRMQTSGTSTGVRVVNDAYNANPESVAAALKTGRWMAGDGRLIAVLGQMAELGVIAAEEHERIGELAARLHVDRLITIGPEAKTIA